MRGISKMLNTMKGLLGRKERLFSKARVPVTSEVEYDGHIEESAVDISDLLKSPDNIIGIGNIKIKHWKQPI